MSYIQELQKEFKAGFSKLRNKVIYSGCFHEDNDCSERIIKAHSIQNNRILNKLSCNGEVLYFQLGEITENGIFELKKMGRKKATTFTGFCGHHDNKLFKPIEEKEYIVGDMEQEFLFAYRAIAKEYHAKKTTKNIYEYILKLVKEENEEEIREYFPSIKRESIQMLELMSNQLLIGTNDALKSLEYYREAMKINLARNKYNKIETKTVVLDEEYGVAVSSDFCLEKDLEGNTINDISNMWAKISPLVVTIIPQSGKTYILLSYFSRERERYRKFFSQILAKPIDEQKSIISNIIVSYCENIVINPEKWDKLKDEEQIKILEYFNATTIEFDKDTVSNSDLNIFI